MVNSDLPPNDPLADILTDPNFGERRLREQRIEALTTGRRRQLDSLRDAWFQRFPSAHEACPELGRRPTEDEHFTIWAGRLKRWGDAVRACGCRARNALRNWQPPTHIPKDSDEWRRAGLARYIALRAADPSCSAADLEMVLRRACTEESAPLLATLYLPSGWLSRIHRDIERAVRSPVRRREPAAPPPSDPCSVIDSLLTEAEARQKQQADARRDAEERRQKLEEHARHRARLAAAFGRVTAFPSEANEQGRKPGPDGFLLWAERIVALGAALRECDQIIERIQLIGRLQAAAQRPAPAAMKYACALLVLGAQGNIPVVADNLEKAYLDYELRRFVLWLPFILDVLWTPYPGPDGLTRHEMPPEGVSLEDYKKAHRAFGERPLDPADEEANPAPPTVEQLLNNIRLRLHHLRADLAAGRQPVPHTSGNFARILKGDDSVFLLPKIPDLWDQLAALGRGAPRRYRRERRRRSAQRRHW